MPRSDRWGDRPGTSNHERSALADSLVVLVSQLEERLPFADFEAIWDSFRAERLRPSSRRRLLALLDLAVGDGALLIDSRLRLDPNSGRLEPVVIYRVNRHHPAVGRALQGR